ncbi:MAG: LysR family transcriptional regulator [Polyangiaceae bacterium]|nr:LysR family transcriptional regulator [Polyangiaceae bacterium]
MNAEPRDGVALQRLLSLNLNLFVALDALLFTASVTQAARQVGVTQPSMSHNLRQLRELLADPLLVRASHGHTLTSRAQALKAPLRAALSELERLLEREPAFNPSQSQRRFRVATSDYFQVVGLPRFLQTLSSLAPNVEVRLLPTTAASAESLLDGSVDLCAGSAEQLPRAPGIQTARLFTERFVVIERRAESTRRLSLKRYVSSPHALVTSDDGPGYVDRLLAQQGLTRRVSLRVPDYAALAGVIAETSLLATVPERYARVMAERFALTVSPPPLKLQAFDVYLAWHERYTQDTGLTWLREHISAENRATKASQ